MARATILIVEDESIVAKDIEVSLIRSGYEILAAVSSAEEAIQLVSEKKPDLVLMDVILAGALDGIEAAAIIRTLADIPVIYLTAYADDQTLERAKLTGPYGYIIKPFELKELNSTIEMALYRSRMDRRLRESEQWLYTILQDIGDAVIAADETGSVTLLNPRAATLTGWSSAEAEGRHLSEVCPLVNECDGGPVKSVPPRLCREGEVFGLISNAALLSKCGALVPVEGNSSPIHDAQGRIIGAVLVFHDVNERRKAECERAKLEEQLRQAQKMEAIGQLAGGIAHDFNNMLTAIIGYGSILQMKLQDASLQENVDEILCAADKAAILTQGLLAFSRKQTMVQKPLDLNDVIRGAEKLLVRLIGEDIELRTIITPRQTRVLADSGHIEQVLMNFATNARDAMPDGGTITIETEVATLEEQPGEYFLITVTDTGKGMDAATREKIFEPFFTTKEPGRGTGLGLSIVYGIVKQHNGLLRVSNNPDGGARFRIYLPLAGAPAEAAAVSDEKKEAGIVGGAETVLLAEDDRTLRLLMKDILESYGYTVILAENGDEAVEQFMLHENEIDLLLLDMVLPRKNAHEVCAFVGDVRPGLSVLLMSGYPQELVSKRGGLREGMQFLQKPVSPQQLLRKVREVLDQEQPAEVSLPR